MKVISRWPDYWRDCCGNPTLRFRSSEGKSGLHSTQSLDNEMAYIFLDVQIGKSPPNRVIIQLFERDAPETCGYFKLLLNHPNGYRGTRFNRIIKEFIIQGGDVSPHDDSIPAAPHVMENIALPLDKAGLVGLARGSASENSGQFFITLVPSAHLQGKHTIFGKVVKGIEWVEKLSRAEVDDTDSPTPGNEVVIATCGELQRRNPRRPLSRESTPPERTEEGRCDRNEKSQERIRSPRRENDRVRRQSRSPEYREERKRHHSRDYADGDTRHHHHHHRHRHHREDHADGSLEHKMSRSGDRSESPKRREIGDRREDSNRENERDRPIPTGPRGYKPSSRHRHESSYGRLGFDPYNDWDMRDDEYRLREAERQRDEEHGKVEPKIIFKGRGVMKFRERF